MREEKHTTNVNGGIGFMSALGLVFIILKLLGKISWSWVWVLSPFWIGAALWVLVIGILCLAGVFAARKQEKEFEAKMKRYDEWMRRR